MGGSAENKGYAFGFGRDCDPASTAQTFDAEGKLLNDTLRRALQNRNAALKSLYVAVKRFEPYLQHSNLRGSEYAHALQDLKKALGQASEILQG